MNFKLEASIFSYFYTVIWFSIAVYLFISFGLSFWASRKIKGAQDFLLAGKSLNVFFCSTALFATWFGSETILGSTEEFAHKGIKGLIEEPLGASLCLLLIGLFFAKGFYKLSLRTFIDFFHLKYGRSVELLISLVMIPSYFGWVAAQLLALAQMISFFSHTSIFISLCIGTSMVVAYTYMGGMWAVALNDSFQTLVIVIGLSAMLYVMWQQTSVEKITMQPYDTEFYNFWPQANTSSYLEFINAWAVVGLGSIPQQDVFQRLFSAKNEHVAQKSALLSSVMYLTIALLPIGIVWLASVQEGHFRSILSIAHNFPIEWIRIAFFGALVSAILSTASGCLIAQSSVMTENIFRAYFNRLNEKKKLRFIRLSMICIAFVCTCMAWKAKSIFTLASEASALSLVALLMPMVAGYYFPSIGKISIWASIVSGCIVYYFCSITDVANPAPLLGLFASAFTLFMVHGIEQKLLRSGVSGRAKHPQR